MKESDPLVAAARAAIGRAKRRGDDEVTPDDLLVGALGQLSRFGIALVGPWALDVSELEGDSEVPGLIPGEGADGDGSSPRGEESPGGDSDTDGGPARGPRYADAAVAVFEEATRLARRDGAAALRLVHLLAALGEHEDGLMARLRERYGFTPLEWRAALARGEVGAGAGDGGASATGAELGGQGAGAPELLDVDQAAAFLGVHPQTVRNYIRAGKLPAYRLAGERFIRVLRRHLLDLLEPVAADDAGEVATELPIDLSTREE